MRKTIYFIMGAVFVTLPFFSYPYFMPEWRFSLPKEIAVCILGLLGSSLLLNRSFHWALGLTSFILLSNTFITGFGTLQMYPMFYWACTIALAAWIVQSEYTDTFINLTIWSGILSAGYAWLQIFDMDFIFRYAPGIDPTVPVSFFGQSTKYGCFIVLPCVMALAKRRWLPFLFMATTAILTWSSFTIGSLAVGMLIVGAPLIGSKRLIKIAISGLVILGSWYVASPKSMAFFDHGRYEVWNAAVKYTWRENKWFGSGAGSFEAIFPYKTRTEADGTDTLIDPGIQPENTRSHGKFIRAHSEYVQLFFEFGLIGCLAVAALLFVLAGVYCFRIILLINSDSSLVAMAAALAAVLVNAIGNFPLQQAPHNLIAAVAVCLLLKK